MSLHRRDFLKHSSLLALAPTIPRFLAQTARAAVPEKDGRVLVVVQLSGGNDGINTIVPFADEEYTRHRKVLRLSGNELLKINDRVGLHPSLDGFARLLESRCLAIIQGVGYPNPSRSHFKSMAYWQTARFDEQNDDGLFVPSLVTGMGWLGTALDDTPPPADRGPASIFVGMEPPPPALKGRLCMSSTIARLDDLILAGEVEPGRVLPRPAAEGDLKAFVERTTLDAFVTADRLKDTSRVKDADARYPGSGLGERLSLTARLIKAGFSTRVYYVEHTGYDTHSSQLAVHARLLNELGGAVRAFLDDLTEARLADRVALLMFSEFGRRVAENGSFGTDHGTAAPVFLAGAAVRPGLFGTTPSLLELEDGDLKNSLDFRCIYATLLEEWLGLSAEKALGGLFKPLPLFRQA